MCEAGFPQGLDKGEAMIILLLNIFFPGVGTLVAACIGDCSCATIGVGIAHLITAPMLVGYVWAICWSVKLRSHIEENDGPKMESA